MTRAGTMGTRSYTIAIHTSKWFFIFYTAFYFVDHHLIQYSKIRNFYIKTVVDQAVRWCKIAMWTNRAAVQIVHAFSNVKYNRIPVWELCYIRWFSNIIYMIGKHPDQANVPVKITPTRHYIPSQKNPLYCY